MMVPSALPENKAVTARVKEQTGYGLRVACQRSQRPLALDIPKDDCLIFGSRSYDRSISAKCDRRNILCVADERSFGHAMGTEIVEKQIVISGNRQQRVIRAEGEVGSFDRLPDQLVTGHIPHRPRDAG